jgi:hypothetical protein
MSRDQEMQLLQDLFSYGAAGNGNDPVGFGTAEALIALESIGVSWKSAAKIEEFRAFFEATIACSNFNGETNSQLGFEMYEEVFYVRLEEQNQRGQVGTEFGDRVFVLAPTVSKFFSFGRFGLVNCYVECSDSDFRVVSNLPLEDPLPTLLDYCIYSLRDPAQDRVGDFAKRSGGALFQIAYGWENPVHNYRFDGYYLRQIQLKPGLETTNLYRSNLSREPDVEEYEAWLAEKRAFARKWLEQTSYPPKWFPGVDPHLP